MSSFDRIERRMPELMSELAPAPMPDYFDDMLRQSRRMGQRPAWASLERWLPMDVVARSAMARPRGLRPILVVLLVGVFLAAGLVLYAGSRQRPLPPPFGPARNGVIVLSTPGEDIAGFDPATGTRTTLIGGPTRDIAPRFARDGSRFMFIRLSQDEVGAFWSANADGSGAHAVVPEPVESFDWSPTGDRIVVDRPVDGKPQTTIVDLVSGATSTLGVASGAEHPQWRPGHEQILSKTVTSTQTTYRLTNSDGSDDHEVEGVSRYAVNDAEFSPDGAQLVYASWESGPGTQGRIHILDVDSGHDRVLMFDGSTGSEELHPVFSPDGSLLLLERYVPGDGGYQLVVGALDGSAIARAIGPRHATGTEGAVVEFSPDGTQVLAVYNDDGAAWLLDVDGTAEKQLDWSEASATWQRLAR